MIRVRPEIHDDHRAIREVNLSAFETPAEADLVEALRQRARPIISLVAAVEAEVVGHIIFSPVRLSGNPQMRLMGLGPMAVRPPQQRMGAGSALVKAGLEQCRRIDCTGVVVLGHPDYYPRFGFTPASRFGIDSEYEVPDEAFMVNWLQSDASGAATGRISYHAAFNEL